ncbi:MAG: hypothetical protein R3224_09590, partial [Balneolaceae bacterium]|nr:hypothetical protein [Balneolaceae bacterium]
ARQLHLMRVPNPSEIETDRFETGKLKNILRIRMPAQRVVGEKQSEMAMTLVPYYAWNNRGDRSMRVWFPEKAGTELSE